MLYQGGRKDPFTFATSSLNNGGTNSWDIGKYPVKIYNGKSELIYQEDAGRDNSGKTPAGGLIIPNSLASSMMETIKNPNTFFGYSSAVINQVGHSKELWDYHWTSYSRGTDGKTNNQVKEPHWHNTYLDGYIVLRSKSIYDPCPYGYRTPINGTYNEFKATTGWNAYSYAEGVQYNNVWLPSIGTRHSVCLQNTGNWFFYVTSTIVNTFNYYSYSLNSWKDIQHNRPDWPQSTAVSIRCIEDATAHALMLARVAWRLLTIDSKLALQRNEEHQC